MAVLLLFGTDTADVAIIFFEEFAAVFADIELALDALNLETRKLKLHYRKTRASFYSL